MAEDDAKGGKRPGGDTREARLRAALKANIARRKAQAKARGQGRDAASESTEE